MHNKDLGTYGESLVTTLLLDAGYNVYLSYGDNTRADIIVENDEGQTFKIQVKTKTREKDKPETTTLYTTKSGPNGYKFKYEKKHLDYFALVDYETKKVAWIPSSVLDESTVINYRHTKPKNNQTKGINFFDDYTKIPFGSLAQ